jgi:DNA-binding MarR family transcriptional regulator
VNDVEEIRWLSAEQERAWRGYRRMRTLLDLQIVRDLSQESRLSETDYDVLSTLTETPGRKWRASELASHLLWSTSRLAHHLGRMERRGLVARTGCEEDGRGATVALTDAGWTTLQAAAAAHVESVRRNLIDLLTPSEVRALDSICTKVIDHLASPGRSRPNDPAGSGERDRRRMRQTGRPAVSVGVPTAP